MDETLDTTPIRDLLHLVNTIMEENPDYGTTIERFAQPGGQAYQDSCAPYIQHNADNARIAAEVDGLLASPAYQLYFEQFRPHASPRAHRRVFFSLPYLAADAPGGIGSNLLELCHHIREVAVWYDSVVSRVDLDRCLAIAQDWLPPDEYTIPKTYFVYDGMGDAFARAGSVCFDLYGVVLSKRPPATRFVEMSSIGTEAIERVLAHEIHHVYSGTLINRNRGPEHTWADRWKADLARELVSEGTAMQCDPRKGIEGEVRQDTTVLRYWVAALNEKLAALDAKRISEAALTAWTDSTYHELPFGLLRTFLKRRFPTGDLDSLVHCQPWARPDFTHTMGWWMVSQISDGGRGRGKVVQLLSSPDSLFAWYNVAVGPGDKSLLISEAHR